MVRPERFELPTYRFVVTVFRTSSHKSLNLKLLRSLSNIYFFLWKWHNLFTTKTKFVAYSFACGSESESESYGRHEAGIKTILPNTRVWAGRTLATSSEVARIRRSDHWRFSPLVLN